MPLTIDERTVRHTMCGSCGREYDHVTGFVYLNGDAHSIYYAACHGHPHEEAWIDVILGTWGEDDMRDHVTFSCRVSAQGATAVDAPVASEGRAPFFGHMLTRDEALAHPLLPTFWQVVDLVTLEDSAVAAQVG